MRCRPVRVLLLLVQQCHTSCQQASGTSMRPEPALGGANEGSRQITVPECRTGGRLMALGSGRPARGIDRAWRAAAAAGLMVRISRTFHNNRSLRVSAMYARGPRLRMSGRPVRAAVHTVLDGAHSRRIRTGLSLQLIVMYWLSFTAVRVA